MVRFPVQDEQPGGIEVEGKRTAAGREAADALLAADALPGGCLEHRPLKIALYSHDAMGLGHLRRNLLVAQALTAPPLEAVVLLITGAHLANHFTLPPGVDCLTLPGFSKESDGHYRTRRLDVGVEGLVRMRGQIIAAALQAFQPDALIVDNVPRGALGELGPALEQLRRQGHTRCILGLPDILDDPIVVRREWRRARNEEAIRSFYHAVWIYGDPAVYDPVHEYGFSRQVASRVRYVGYLDQRSRLMQRGGEGEISLDFGLPPGKLVLCMLGGGHEGTELGETFAQTPLPLETNGIILAGPLMASERVAALQAQVADNPRMRVIEFLPEPGHLLRQADRVVSTGGYNTACEVMAFEKPTLIVPRIAPRQGQLIRAQRLQEMGLATYLHPEALCPETLGRWLEQAVHPPHVHGHLDFDGFNQVTTLIGELVTQPHRLSLRAGRHPRRPRHIA